MEQIKETARRLQSVIDTAIDGIITINNRGIIESINKSALSLFGYDHQNELIGKNVHVLMPSPDREQHNGYLNNYVKTRRPKIIGIGREVTGLKKDMTRFPFRLAVSEVILNDKIIFTGIIHDLTDLNDAKNRLVELNKKLENKVADRTYELESVVNTLLKTNTTLKEREEDLQRALTKEKELGELKSRFVSMASHEFRTPLATILSSVGLIGRYTQTEQQVNREKHIKRIKNAVNNLTGILNDFLSLSKLEEGIIAVDPCDFDITELCEEVIDEMAAIIRGTQKIIHAVNGDKKGLYHDKRILKNIMFNLISNAVKYSHDDGIINCNISFEKERLTLEVEDHGIGIPGEDQKYMFQRFFRAGNVTNIQGTGLGLNIVKRYVDLLNGEISFKSEYGQGTTFTIKLPYHAREKK